MIENQREIVIQEKNRDKGKKFIITAMSTYDTEMIALKIIFHLMNTDAKLPENVDEMGFSELAEFGIDAFRKLDFEKVKPILDEMWDKCLLFKPSENAPARPLVYDGSDIQEVSTRIKLRMEIIKLHKDFYATAAQ
jgi:hypothetical protein